MTNWLPTFPLLNRSPSPPDPRDLLAQLDGWSIAELMRNERFAQAPDQSLPPMSAMGARAEPTAASQPDWLTNAQRQSAPAMPWPETPPPVELDPFERAAIRTENSVISHARRRPFGPPFFDEPPQDYPSHLGPVPRAPNWEEVVPGPTPWSPLRAPTRATDWGRTVSGTECLVSEDSAQCTTRGGRRVTFPRGGLQSGMRFAPGESNYHSYSIPDGPVRADRSTITQGIVNRPTRALPLFVRPASPEGTPNDATPPAAYPVGVVRRILRGEWPFFTNVGPVRSYVTTDQTGTQVVVNVTEPGHPLYPGIVIRYVTETPAGPVIRNEGTGRGSLQGPEGPARGAFNNQVWEGQAQEIFDEERRNRGWSRPLGRP